jgi:Antitoxin Xre/MbcA/ParS C-terminal toxin-binding domain/Antitoxin Xre-like helix-turn-helix domain
MFMAAHAHPLPRPAVTLDTPAASAAALRTFFRIAKAWSLSATEEQRLLGVQRSTVYAWRSGDFPARLDAGTLERLSHVFGIYAALQVLFPVPERADAWLRKPNTAPLFGGDSALSRMLGGQVADLFQVRQYLDAVRGGGS